MALVLYSERDDFSTMTGSSGYKEKIESKIFVEFDYNVKKFKTWFSDTRSEITKIEGDGKYNEYSIYF